MVDLVAAPNGGCALLSDGSTRCWGIGVGDLGDPGPRPVEEVIAGGGVLALSNSNLSNTHCVATAGNVTCSGSFIYQKSQSIHLGAGSQPLTDAPALSGIVVAQSGACGLSAASTAWCWGAWDSGVRGAGDSVGRPAPLPGMDATPVAGGHAFTQLARGRDVTCGRTPASEAYCWGGSWMIGGDTVALDSTYACGNGWWTRCANTPRMVVTDESITAIAAGPYQVCVLDATGGVHCWGDNYFGQLGTGDNDRRILPTAVPGLPASSLLALGMSFTCAATDAGAVWCWGDDGISAESYPGIFGPGSSLTPVQVANGRPYAKLVAGDRHLCGLSEDGKVYCWGDNQYGQLGLGDSLSRTVPTQVEF